MMNSTLCGFAADTLLTVKELHSMKHSNANALPDRVRVIRFSIGYVSDLNFPSISSRLSVMISELSSGTRLAGNQVS